MINMAVCESEKSSTNFINNGTMSDDEEVASDVPPRYLFPVQVRFSRAEKDGDKNIDKIRNHSYKESIVYEYFQSGHFLHHVSSYFSMAVCQWISSVLQIEKKRVFCH